MTSSVGMSECIILVSILKLNGHYEKLRSSIFPPLKRDLNKDILLAENCIY
jgi:hypothetical protein